MQQPLGTHSPFTEAATGLVSFWAAVASWAVVKIRHVLYSCCMLSSAMRTRVRKQPAWSGHGENR